MEHLNSIAHAPGKRIEMSTVIHRNNSQDAIHGLLQEFKGNDWYVFVFTASKFSGALIDSPEGQLEWIEDSKLGSLNLWDSDHIFFPWIERGEFFSAKFEYEGDKMRGYDVVFHRP